MFVGTLDSSSSPSFSVTITVNAVNDGPTAVDDATETPEDTEVCGNVMDGRMSNGIPDSDPDNGDKLTVNGAPPTPPGSGVVNVLNADGSFCYTPNTGFVGTDT